MGSRHQTTNTHTTNEINTHTTNKDVYTVTNNNNYREYDKVTNNHYGNTYKHGFTDLDGMHNDGVQQFDLSATLMNLNNF